MTKVPAQRAERQNPAIPRTCPRCDRALRPLREIQADLAGALAKADAEAEQFAEEEAARVPKLPRLHLHELASYRLGVVKATTTRLAGELACHAGTCARPEGSP